MVLKEKITQYIAIYIIKNLLVEILHIEANCSKICSNYKRTKSKWRMNIRDIKMPEVLNLVR